MIAKRLFSFSSDVVIYSSLSSKGSGEVVFANIESAITTDFVVDFSLGRTSLISQLLGSPVLHIGDYVKSFQSIYLALPEKCRSEDRKEYNSIRDTVRMLKKTDKFVSTSLERSQNNAKLLDVKRRLAVPEALRV